MSAPLGNEFWKLRGSHGPKPIFATPDDLWSAACEYFQWVEDNPLQAEKLVSYQGVTTREPEARMRAMTVSGLCVFLDISEQGWRDQAKREGFEDVTARINAIIRTQKFEGAAADLLNASIIARDLGLADRQELTGKDGTPLNPLLEVSDRQRWASLWLVIRKIAARAIQEGNAELRDEIVKSIRHLVDAIKTDDTNALAAHNSKEQTNGKKTPSR